MPILRFHSVKKEDVIKAGIEFQAKLASTFETGTDNITLEIIESTFICNAEIENTPYPMVEILSFKRAKQIEDNVVNVIANTLKELGYEGCDIFYTHLAKECYYVDGKSL